MQCNFYYDNRSKEVVRIYEFLAFEEIVQAPSEAYFGLKQLVTTKKVKKSGLIQLISMRQQQPVTNRDRYSEPMSILRIEQVK